MNVTASFRCSVAEIPLAALSTCNSARAASADLLLSRERHRRRSRSGRATVTHRGQVLRNPLRAIAAYRQSGRRRSSFERSSGMRRTGYAFSQNLHRDPLHRVGRMYCARWQTAWIPTSTTCALRLHRPIIIDREHVGEPPVVRSRPLRGAACFSPGAARHLRVTPMACHFSSLPLSRPRNTRPL